MTRAVAIVFATAFVACRPPPVFNPDLETNARWCLPVIVVDEADVRHDVEICTDTKHLCTYAVGELQKGILPFVREVGACREESVL